MKKSILLIYKSLVALFNILFSETVDKRSDYLFKRLKSVSYIDSIEKVFREQSFRTSQIEYDDLIKQKEQVVDIRNQFKVWSQNMKEYDLVKSRLVNTA
jgi:hypothetical protein